MAQKRKRKDDDDETPEKEASEKAPETEKKKTEKKAKGVLDLRPAEPTLRHAWEPPELPLPPEPPAVEGDVVEVLATMRKTIVVVLHRLMRPNSMSRGTLEELLERWARMQALEDSLTKRDRLRQKEETAAARVVAETKEYIGA